ncbi:hypothetical protein CIB93_08885 [Streptomyces sp. WZ.A104]|uniref:hypothetical protein n=1 Tax=Streptomyces sp. WZ.A104 TaxID=2023771 RepID=UPI000BBCB37A|nr:hypothetical protein [Streptomyces sp. WZ.A104]PCG86343.1 hypothetical protein CIB93_08885 [Streptomyces sp. WZ.A104]
MATEGQPVTVSITCGQAATDPQISFCGIERDVHGGIASAFGFDSNSVSSLALYELAVEAGQLARSATVVMKGLGGHVVPQTQASSPPGSSTTQPAAGGENGALLTQIAACATTDALRRLWAENQAAFSDQAVMDAWKARGRELKP